MCVLPLVRETKFHTCTKATGTVTVVYIFILLLNSFISAVNHVGW